MLMVKIIGFYALLVVFIVVSWFWHRLWFKDNVPERLRNTENQDVKQGANTAARVGTVVLVLTVLIGIYLIIYALLA